jgi:hypothetical protein
MPDTTRGFTDERSQDTAIRRQRQLESRIQNPEFKMAPGFRGRRDYPDRFWILDSEILDSHSGIRH